MSEWNLVSFLWVIGFPTYLKIVLYKDNVTLIYFTKLMLKSNFAAARVEGVKVNMAHVYPVFSSQMLPETVSFTPINLILDKWAVSLDYSPFSNLQGYISERAHHLLSFRCVSRTCRFSWGLKNFQMCCGDVELLITWQRPQFWVQLEAKRKSYPASMRSSCNTYGPCCWEDFLFATLNTSFLKQLVYSQGTEDAVGQQNLVSLIMIITLEVLA